MPSGPPGPELSWRSAGERGREGLVTDTVTIDPGDVAFGLEPVVKSWQLLRITTEAGGE